MAAEVLQDFLARLGFQVEGADKFDGALASSATRVAAFGVAIQTLATGIYAAVYKIAEAKSELLTLAEAIDVPVHKLEELQYVAEQSGSSAQALNSSLEGLTQAIGGAMYGSGGIEAFARLGINIRDANGQLRNSADVLMDVGKRLQGMDKAKASKFLGDLGIDRSLVRMLTSDVSGLRDEYAAMYAAVGVDADQAAEQSRAFVGQVKQLKTVVKMIGDALAAILVGGMGADVARFRKMLIENMRKIIPVLKTIIDVVLRIAKTFGALTARLLSWVGLIVDWFGRLDGTTQTLILAVLGFAAAWKFLNLSFLATPLGLFLTLAAVVVALIDDFQTWLEGGESLINWGDGWTATLGALVSGLAVFKMAMIAIPAVMSAVSTAGGVLTGVIRAIGMAATANPIGLLIMGLATAAMLIIANWETVKAWFSAFWEWLKESFDWLADAASSVADFFGFGGDDEEEKNGTAPQRPVLGPSPSATAGRPLAGQQTTSIDANTVINVQAAASPEATARAVAGSQNRVNADLVRHARGAAK